MASLALMVAILFLGVILSGPIAYLFSKVKIIPKIIVYIISVFSICIGLWWVIVVPTFIRYSGLLSVLLGYAAINNSRNRG